MGLMAMLKTVDAVCQQPTRFPSLVDSHVIEESPLLTADVRGKEVADPEGCSLVRKPCRIPTQSAGLKRIHDREIRGTGISCYERHFQARLQRCSRCPPSCSCQPKLWEKTRPGAR